MVGEVLYLHALGYDDDVTTIVMTVGQMTKMMTVVVDSSISDADMFVSMPKTFRQHVYKHTDTIKSTEDQINKTTKNTNTSLQNRD